MSTRQIEEIICDNCKDVIDTKGGYYKVKDQDVHLCTSVCVKQYFIDNGTLEEL